MPAQAAQVADLVELTANGRLLAARLSAAVGDLDVDPASPTGLPDKPGLFYASIIIRKFGEAAADTLITRVEQRGIPRGRFKQAMKTFTAADTQQSLLAKINAA